MDLHHLRVFQAAARTGSFTAAGRDLSLSQSTVSLHIKHLEEEFGCALFRRTAKRVVITEAGRTLLQYVDRTFNELRNAELAVREFSTSQQGTIRLGVGASTLIYLLPRVLSEYRKRYPAIDLRVTTGVTEVLLQGLIDRTLDLAIVMGPAEGLAHVQSVPLMKEELVIALASDHPLTRKTILAPQDLQDLNMISHLRGTAMLTVQRDYLSRLGVQPRIVMEMENMEAIKSLVSIGLGAALLPLCSVSGANTRGVVFRKVRGMPMSRDLLLAAADWAAHPPATQRLARRIMRKIGNDTPRQAGASIATLNHKD